MADTVASPLLNMLSGRLNSLVGNSRILKKFRLTLAEIQTVVHDAEVREEDEALCHWLAEVKDAAYDADDLIDELDWVTTKKLTSFFSLSENPLLFRFRLERKMKDIEGQLKMLLKRRKRLVQSVVTVPGAVSSKENEGNVDGKVRRRETHSFVFQSEVFGRNDDKEIVLERLLSDSGLQVDVIPIVGMGGLGKTTLAQLIYNDERVRSHYERRCWVSVGQDFDLTMIGKAIVEPKARVSQFFLTMDTVGTIVRQELGGKRFLIVIDDVWNEDDEKWNILRGWFSVGARGSGVVVTTRSQNVAALMGTTEPYALRPLSGDDCWSLFKQVAFTSVEEENIKFAEIGKRLVAKCKGLPLAVKTLAGLMRFKKEESEWLLMKDDDIWNIPEFESSVLPALRPSYNHLPPHLKQCFASFSIFPKDYTISKEKLIQLWIAEGFIQSTKGSKKLEDIGNDYFMELLRRSFFMDVRRDDFGEIVECQMHDLIHDLARSVAKIGCSIVESGALQNVSDEVRHASLVGNSQHSTNPELLNEAKNLRTLLLFSSHFEKIPSLFLKLRSLRVLDVSGSGIQKLSKSLGNLIHLRYLSLSRTNIERLPDSISNLRSLKTLELIECYNLEELPRAVCELTKLRHLDIESCCSLSYMPSGIWKLKLLQKLPVFILCNMDGCASLSELSDLHLRGKLEIKNLEFVENPEDAFAAKLYDKHNLQSLELSWGLDVDQSAELSYAVLESLQPPPELKVLNVTDYKGVTYPPWIMNSVLLNLSSVSLTNCSCPELPPLGQLPNLKDLYIKGMPEVRVIGNEFYGAEGTIKGFPSLKQLELYDMSNLFEWRSFEESSAYIEKEAFPCLELLTIRGCSKLIKLPLLRNLQNLALWNCNEMLLSSLALLTSLSSLVMNEFRGPMSLPMYVGNFNSIRKMTIYNCDNLVTLLEEGMQGFSSLKHLSILYCDGLKTLPVSLRYLTSLEKLEIAECRELAYIPGILQDLYSLEELIIEGCPILDSLPDSIRLLNRLQKLVIRRCPKLYQSLNTENGEEYSKIAHIPYIDRDIEADILNESE